MSIWFYGCIFGSYDDVPLKSVTFESYLTFPYSKLASQLALVSFSFAELVNAI